MTTAQRQALTEAIENRGFASSTIPLAPFPTIRSLVRAGLMAWTREPERRERLAPQGWTGHVTVEWLYAARVTPAGYAAVAE